MPSLPRTLMLALGLAAVAPALARGQAAPLSADVSLTDFGVDHARSVAWGRVAVVHAPAGAFLSVEFVTSTTPSARAQALPDPDPGVARPAGDADRRARERRLHGTAEAAPLRALWVWNTAQLLADMGARVHFLDFVGRERIDRVFLQLPPGAGLEPAEGFVPFDGPALGPLVAELRAQGTLTYALDGDPEYARPRNHEGVLRTVSRLVEHNRTAPLEQRFHGVRYDVEPYLLPGFQGPRRAEILSGWVRLLERVAEEAERGGLAFGVDIPFWLDGPDEVTGEPFQVELDAGEQRPVLGRVLELVDDVSVMAYRTVASGPDGVLTHARGELTRAGELGVEVFVGIETTPLPDETRYTLRGPGRTGLPPELDAPWIVLQDLGDRRVRVWLVEGAPGREALAGSGADPASLTYWFAGTPVPLEGARLSFRTLGADAMWAVTGEIIDGFRGVEGFRGLAFHDYVGLSTLLDQR